MLREKLTKNISIKRLGILVLFVLFFFLTRVPRLHNDVINPDGVNWHYRAQQFMNGLKYGDLSKTYPHYHPGVTVMWATAPSIELFRQFPLNEKYDMYNFIGFDFIAKYSLITVQLVLTVLLLFYLSKIIGFSKAIVSTIIFSFEPFFVGNSRLYHLDVLLTLLLFTSLCVFYLALNTSSKKYYLLTGIFLGLSFLTKTVSLIAVAYVAGYIVITAIVSRKFKPGFVKLLIVLGVFSLTVFTLFPAMWVRPVYTIVHLFNEGVRVGVRKGHEVVFLGDDVMDGGILFYPLVLLIKLSPFLLAGIFAYITLQLRMVKTCISKLKSKDFLFNSFAILIAGFYIAYLLIMTVPTKKLDRYMLVEYPFFAFLATQVFFTLFAFYKDKKSLVAIFLMGFVIYVVYSLLSLFPYYFVYTSPLLGNSTYANSLIGQKPFGVGVYDLKQFILEKYGYYPRLGIIDVKPIESIYPNSLVKDIREAAIEEYDILVLGPNENLPPRVLNSPFDLIKDTSIYIDGLEYWRIYVKRPK